ncbi:MAG TPA: sugar ABC transporter ATP-binding protein, partial [Spirochaetia bacterium]|nr:sugar ABC transporter ATP-binding protein [Spirochaetia bacterium]
NQQKALLAKWLQLDPRVLLLHEPTQGVDVGARQQVFAMIRNAARAGSAVVCASSDYEQLSTLCSRVLVFSGGRIVAELTGEAMSKEGITHACYQGLAAS